MTEGRRSTPLGVRITLLTRFLTGLRSDAVRRQMLVLWLERIVLLVLVVTVGLSLFGCQLSLRLEGPSLLAVPADPLRSERLDNVRSAQLLADWQTFQYMLATSRVTRVATVPYPYVTK